MCGIAGYWGTGSRDLLNTMRDTLTHRGPDEKGAIEIDSIGLAHRRLSIIDLSPTGHQPMQSKDGCVSIVFNGEIYNYRELRNEFLKDCTFEGSSDTEVLVHLYLKFGESFLEKIRGMFAIALYDRNKRRLILARDHLGKKPLYWSKNGATLIFGSELKALRAHPMCPSAISRVSVAQYLIYEYIPAPATIYEDVYKLSPGTYLTYDGSEITHKTFSSIGVNHTSYSRDLQHAQNDLFHLLQASVEKRMVADVPVGVFLSGGLDSSTVAFFAQRMKQERVKTFSIGFTDASFDESSYARKVATSLGTDHYERIVGPKDLCALIEQLPRVIDEPMADSSIIPTLLLSEFARSEVKVALGGDGADELFWGYETFFAHRVGGWYEKIPSSVQGLLCTVANRLPVSHTYMSLDFKIKKFLSGFETSRARRNTYWLSAFTPKELSSILTYEINESTLLKSTDELYRTDINFWDSLQLDYLKGYLAEGILTKVDRASMAYGLEVRAPFLDLDLVNFAISLDKKHKFHGCSGKYILKQVMKEYLPNWVIKRPKKGFGIPIGSWIKDELRDLFTEKILNGGLVQSGLFKREGLAILLESHLSGKIDQRKKLWALLVLSLWIEEWHGQ